MAKDKDRALNPAAAQRKADKAKALKKARNEKQTQRNEKLARRNPDRIQRQIDDLKALETAGDLKPREQAILAELERDLKAVKKAREILGESSQNTGNREPPQRDSGRRDGDRTHNANNTVLGKRRHNGERTGHGGFSSGEETDESVRNIPMPRDTPPPMPRARMPYNNRQKDSSNQNQAPSTNDSSQSLGLPPRPPPAVQAQTTYSSAPQIRDLKKEAVSRFVPTAVKQKQNAIHGMGTLLEPEELDRLEQAGYMKGPAAAVTENKQVNDDEEARRLAEEEARFEQEMAMETASDTNVGADIDIDSRDYNEGPVSAVSPEEDSAPTAFSGQPSVLSAKVNEEQKPNSKPTNGPLLSGYYSDDDDDEDDDDVATTADSSNPIGGTRGIQQSQSLFSSLPKPRRQVEMEEVKDEDL